VGVQNTADGVWERKVGLNFLSSLAHFGTHSHALVLVHFPICLLVNALFELKDAAAAWASLPAMAAAWLLSNLAAVPFHRWIQAPVGRLRPAELLLRALRA